MKHVENENVRYTGGLLKTSTNTGKAEESLQKSAKMEKIAMNEPKKVSKG
jgi:hypothetical protein